MAPVGHVLGALALVALSVVAHPKNLFLPFAKFVCQFEPALEFHAGNDIFEPVVHVNVVVCVLDVIVAALVVLIVPVPPFAFNVIVFVFALLHA